MKVFMILLIVLMFVSCMQKEKKYEEEKFIFGTFIKVVIYSEDKKNIESTFNKIFQEIERIDKNINGYTENSDIWKINKKSGEFVEVSIETINLLKKSMEISKLTEGKYDISIKPVFEIWKFTKEDVNKIPEEEEIKRELEKVNYKNIVIKGNRVKLSIKDMQIDLSSFLKGYAIYRGKMIMKDNGIENGFISAISSIEALGKKEGKREWKIGVQNPEKPSQILKVLKLENKALGVSGDYQTFIEVNGKKYHHILDAKTGYPGIKNKMSVVIASDAFIADIYSTAFFLIEPKEAINIANEIYNLDVMIVDKEMNVYYSKEFEKYIEK